MKNNDSKRINIQNNRSSGFTLIELSIVLVIIGLIVGGVLIGQDLIKSAEIRSTISQYEKYNATINTFRSKYNGLPGDLSSTQATAFGLYSTGMTGAAGLGDGNGLVESGSGAALQLGETVVLWRHLTDASLIDGSFGGTLASGGVLVASANHDLFYPQAKIGRGNDWIAGSASGLNYYLLSNLGTLATTGDMTTSTSLTPIESYNIDTKLDDGMPNTGVVQARDGGITTSVAFATVSASNAGQSSVAGTTTGDCLAGSATAETATNTYARNTTVGNSPNCILRLRFN